MAPLPFRQLDATARPAICSLPPALLVVVIRGGELRSSHALLGHRGPWFPACGSRFAIRGA